MRDFTIGKYEFDSKEQAEEKIKALGFATDEEGNEYLTHPHDISHLGNIVLEQAEIDEEGNITKEAILSDKYSVDVCWNGLDKHPYGWTSYAVEAQGNGVHRFLGLDYQKHKIQ